MPTAIVQRWGTPGSAPDQANSFSLHSVESDRVEFIDEYWKRLSGRISAATARPIGKPYLAAIDAQMYVRVKLSRNGIELSGNAPDQPDSPP